METRFFTWIVRAQKTREDGVFTLKLDEGVSLAMLVSFAQDMFPGVSTEDIGVWPAYDGELVVSCAAADTCSELKGRRAHPRCLGPCVRNRGVTRRGGTSSGSGRGGRI